VSAKAADTMNVNEEERHLVVGATSRLAVPQGNGKVNWKCNNENIVKITKGKYSQKSIIKARKKGNCIITATCDDTIYRFYIHAEPKEVIKKVTDNKISFNIEKVKKNKRYVILRMKVSNGTKSEIDIEPTYKVSKRVKGRWVGLKSDVIYEGAALVYTGNTSHSYSLAISNIYDREKLIKGTYRIGIMINNKMKYAKFVI